MTAPRPLDGCRVLDLSQAIAGPFVGRALADLGADVVKVEWPNGDVTNRFGSAQAGLTGLFTHMNAGKRGIGVDRKAPGGPDLLLRLAARADIVVENFRPGVLERGGLGYAERTAGNPGLIMLSISGFGAASPESQRQAYAPVIHAESGLLARQSELDGRPVSDLAMSLADEVAALHGTVAVLAALNLRHRTGTGQHIDLSMLEAMLATDDYVHSAIEGELELYGSRGYVWDAVGGQILISADHKALWHRLSRHAGLSDPTPAGADLATKVAARAEAMAAWIRSFEDRRVLIVELEAADLAWADLRTTGTIFESPSLRDRACIAEVDDHAGGTRGVIRMPYRFSSAATEVAGPAPRRGQHNAAVLADWLDAADDEVRRLIAAGTIQETAGPSSG